ncbi:MAG: tetratricopeptide repeat protein [Bryobacteraceae bacterium]
MAILPFTTSGDSEGQLGSIAVEEALHNLLEALQFSILFGSSDPSPIEPASAEHVARRLGAELFITGTVHKKLDQLDAQVVITDSAGLVLFKASNEFQRNDVSGLADAIAMQVAGFLGARGNISPPVYRRPRYDSYGRYINALSIVRQSKSPDDLRKAIALYNASLDLEADGACTYAGLAEADLRMFQMTHDTSWLSYSSGAVAQAATAKRRCMFTEYRVGQLLKATGQTISSLSLMKRLSDRLPYSDQLKRDIAHLYLRLGMYHEAVSESMEATGINPKLWVNHAVLGECYLAQGSYAKAIATFNDSLALNSASPTGYHNLGAAYIYSGAFERAIDPLRRAILLRPTAASHSNLGTAYFYLGNAQASIEEYEKACLLEPKSEEYAGNLATAYRLLGRSEKARTWFLRALGLARQNLENGTDAPRYEAHIALYEAHLGHVKNSYRMIAAARNLDPRSADLLCAQIVIESLAKDYSRAIESASQFFALGFPAHLIKANPSLATLRQDPRFIELTKNSLLPR